MNNNRGDAAQLRQTSHGGSQNLPPPVAPLKDLWDSLEDSFCLADSLPHLSGDRWGRRAGMGGAQTLEQSTKISLRDCSTHTLGHRQRHTGHLLMASLRQVCLISVGSDIKLTSGAGGTHLHFPVKERNSLTLCCCGCKHCHPKPASHGGLWEPPQLYLLGHGGLPCSWQQCNSYCAAREPPGSNRTMDNARACLHRRAEKAALQTRQA